MQISLLSYSFSQLLRNTASVHGQNIHTSLREHYCNLFGNRYLALVNWRGSQIITLKWNDALINNLIPVAYHNFVVITDCFVGYLWEPIASVIDQGVQKWKGGGVSRKNKHRRLWLGNQGLWNNSLLDWTRSLLKTEGGLGSKVFFLWAENRLNITVSHWVWRKHTHTHSLQTLRAILLLPLTVTSHAHITMMMAIISGGHWALGGRRCCQGYSVVGEFVSFWLTAERWLWCHHTLKKLDVKK